MSCADEAARASLLRGLILKDPCRVEILETAEHMRRVHQLPDALLAAGFVRNCFWDHLHGFQATALNDIDLIYFSASELDSRVDAALLHEFSALLPAVSWDVKNQARMHLRHGDPAYADSEHAMRYWPECETAIGMRIDGSRELVSSFGLGSLFAGEITPGPHRPPVVAQERAQRKAWLQRWPKLRFVKPGSAPGG